MEKVEIEEAKTITVEMLDTNVDFVNNIKKSVQETDDIEQIKHSLLVFKACCGDITDRLHKMLKSGFGLTDSEIEDETNYLQFLVALNNVFKRL